MIVWKHPNPSFLCRSLDAFSIKKLGNCEFLEAFTDGIIEELKGIAIH